MHQGEAGSADPIQEWRHTGPEADAAPAAVTSCATAGGPSPAGTDEQPASAGAAGAANTLSGFQGATSALLSVTLPEEHVVNAPISWEQFLWGKIDDWSSPAVALPVLAVLLNWLQGSEPLTWRAVITVLVLAIVAGYQGALRVTGNAGLQLRLRSMGQINGGR